MVAKFRTLIAAAVVLLAQSSTVTANDLSLSVKVQEKGFVLRGDQIVREVGSGQHFRLPFVERWALVNALHERSAPFEVATVLADGSDCTVSGRLDYRITDARKALEWRLENDPELPESGTIKPSLTVYTLAPVVFGQRLAGIVADISPAKARAGAIEAVFATSALRLRDLDDGTSSIRSIAQSVSCSDWKPSVRSQCLMVFGPPQPFARQGRWTIAAEGADTITTSLRDGTILMADGARAKTVSPVVTMGITDSEAFQKTLGSRKNRAGVIASQIVADAIGLTAGQRTMPQLDAFYDDFFENHFPERMGERLAKYGLQIIGADFSTATYSVGLLDPDCTKAE